TVSDSSCSSCAGVGLTLNGTNDIILQMGNPNNSLTAITGGAFSSTAFFDENLTGGEAYAAAKNTNNGTAPTWTQSPSGTYVNVGAIAISTTPPPPSWSVVQVKSMDCGTGATCTITGLSAIGAGHVGVLQAIYGNGTTGPIAFSSGTGGGSYTDCGSACDIYKTGIVQGGIITAYNLSMTGGGTTASMTLASSALSIDL